MIGVGLVTGVLVARILGPEGRGLYAVAVTVATTGVQFGNLGLHASNTYTVAKNRDVLSLIVGNSLFASFAIGSIFAAAAWIFFVVWPSLAPLHGLLLVLALAWIPLGLAHMLLQNILLGIFDVRAYNVIELATQASGIVLLGVLLFFKIVTVTTVYAIGFVSLIISIVWTYWRIKLHLADPPGLSLSLFKENIQYGLKAYIAAFFSFLVLRIDILMIKYLLNAEEAGYYSIAVNMADLIYLLPVITGTILFPKLSALHSNQEKRTYTKKAAKLTAVVMLCFILFSAFLASPIVRLLFGNAFLPAVPSFLWLLPGVLMLSVNVIFMNYFASIGMPLITIYSPAVAAICNVLLNLKLIHAFGIVGASLSSVFSYGLMLCASVLYITYMKRQSS